MTRASGPVTAYPCPELLPLMREAGVAAMRQAEQIFQLGEQLPALVRAMDPSAYLLAEQTTLYNTSGALYMDKREEQHVLCDGRELKIAPDVCADFTKMPFPDESFWLVVFDPPHMNSLGENSWLAKKYGRLIGDWRDDLREGFLECFRVLKTNGTLVFNPGVTNQSVTIAINPDKAVEPAEVPEHRFR